MKNSIIAFLFSAISFCCLAQPAFTEKTFNDIIKRFEKDPKQYLSTETAPDFMFVGTGGYVSELKGFTALYDIYKPTSYVTSGIKIRQYGNTCVVTGRMKHSYTNIKTGAPRVIDELFTYTYVQNKDKWLYVSAQHSEAPNGDKPEEIVKQWITEYNKDNKAFFVKHCSDDFIASNTAIDGGKFFGKESIEKRAEGKTSDLETTNMKSFKSGNLAVVMGNLIWHNKQADGSDKPEKTVSTFVMQKKEGKWWYVGHHISPLKE